MNANEQKIIQFNIEAAQRRYYDEIHPFVMIVVDNDNLVIEYINRPVFGVQADRVIGRGLFDVYESHAQPVLDVLNSARKDPGKAVNYVFDMPTLRGLARFSEQCVYNVDRFYTCGTFIGMY